MQYNKNFPQKNAKDKLVESDMIYTGYELVWMFFLYSFLGWCMEVVYAAAGRKQFVNRGFLNGILCPVYGFAMVFMLIFMDSLRDRWFYLFLGCMIVGTVIELMTGLMLEKVFHLRLWDYSGKKFQAGGYICLWNSAIWGLLGILVLKFLSPLVVVIIRKIPQIPGMICLTVYDVVISSIALSRYTERAQRVKPDNRIEAWIDEEFPDERMARIYPNALMKK